MKYIRLFVLGFFLGNISCNLFRSGYKTTSLKNTDRIEVYGHRGEAGYYPENTIPGFLSAVSKGVDAIEMDVVISKDKKVVVSHEPFMASHYMLDERGRPIPKDKEHSYNIYKMDYDRVRKFDSGSKKNRNFPRQHKMPASKPLLKEVFREVENYLEKNQVPPVNYMIEVKSSPGSYNIFQPEPAEFVDLIMEVVASQKLENKIIIKSFDPHILNEVHAKHPAIATSYLVSKPGIEHNLSKLNFTPSIYSPRHKLIKSKKFTDSIHLRNMRLVPWTVNRRSQIKRMINLEVDGIISDYPERVFKALRETGN